MSTGDNEVPASSSSSRNPAPMSASSSSQAHDVSVTTAAGDDTINSIQFRNGVASPGSPGSEADSTINSNAFAPSILASRLGRSIYSSAGAAGSTLSLSGSGFNSPSIALTGFNAVSTVLNNPSKRQHPIDPKSSRFPAVNPNHVPAEIPKVKKADFEPYLSSVRPEWDRFMRNQSMGRQGKATIEQQRQQQQQQQLQQERASTHDSSFDSEPLGKPKRQHRSTASMASLSADLQAVPPPQARKRLPNLSAVPQVFFSEDFDLGNPYTFDQVTERYKAAGTSPSEQNGATAPTYDVALNQMLQEKLSYYSDVVEQHLIIEIGQQSSSFFAALENLNDLNAEAESCLRKIDALKSDLETIDEKQAKKGLRVIKQQHQRRQLERKQLAVHKVREIIERRDLVRLLLQQGETEEALDLLNKLRSTLHRSENDQKPGRTDAATNSGAASDSDSTDHHVVLSDLQCLANIPEQLEDMEQTLASMLEQDLIAILKQDISARLTAYREDAASSTSTGPDYFKKAAEAASTKPSITTNNLSVAPDSASSASPLTPTVPPQSPFGHSARALSSVDSDLASRIAPLVAGLAKTGGIEKAVAVYRDVAVQAIQETWRETLSSSNAEMAETIRWLQSEDLSKYDDHDNLPEPAARIRDLEHARFLEIGRDLFEILIECLKAIDAHCKLVARILDQLNSSTKANGSASGTDTAAIATPNGPESTHSALPAPPTMPQGVPANIPAKLSDVVVASAEQAHTLCARLLALRATTHASLELPPFLVVFQLCWSFVLSSEQLCRKMIVGLRGTVLSQAKGFLANFHRKRIERAAKAVEEEMWAQAEVGAEIQSQIHQIVSSAVEDPADFVVTGSETRSDIKGGEEQAAVQSADDAPEEPAKTLDIEDRQYFVVDASLDVLSLLVDYLKVIINLPLLTTEAMARVVEFLKQFNSRTCQVVLGAGAMRSAGLKNITAKHLALASQSLSIMISLIPYIRETVRRHLSPKQAVMLTEFDKLRRDFQEHQYEIHAKLVAIMSDRLTVHCRTLSAIDWNAEKPSKEAQEGEQTKEAEPNKCAADLVKETATLHKVLSKYLQAVVVEHVIGQVLRAIDARLAQEFDKISVQNQQALDQMHTDVRYLGTKLSVLKHVEWKDEALQQVLSSKRVAPPAPTVNVTTSTAPSTPTNDAAPGSPAIDKPATSQFGPVTYKPRIPNIFARRQQQQQQQQQSQSNSPRGSVDVPGSSTPVDARRSVETTPRTSMQLQQQPASTEQAATDEPKQPDTPGPEPPAKSQGSGAKSLEEEANESNDIPPTTPSKTQDVQSESTPIVKDEDGAARDSEDLVAPVVPAPEAVAKVLSEGGQAATELPKEATVTNEAAAVGAPVEAGNQAVQENKTELEAPTSVTGSQTGEEKPESSISQAASEPQQTSHAPTETSAPADASEPTKLPQPSTPTKGSAVLPTTVQSATGTPAGDSPARSGASTPATATPSGTPAKPGRMSLKERLAEAARKRAQQAAPARTSNQADPQATSSAAAVPAAESTTAATGSSPAEIPAKEQKKEAESEQTPSAEPSQTASASDATPVAADPIGEAVDKSEKEAKDKTVHTEAETATDKQDPPTQPVDDTPEASTEVTAPATASAQEVDTPPQPTESTAALEASEAPTGAVDAGTADHKEMTVPTAITESELVSSNAQDEETRHTKEDGQQPSKADEEAKDEAEAMPVTLANEKTLGEPFKETNADADGDGDEEGEEADTNEGTNDSAVSGTPSGGNKKNKKKKKKGKKK